MFNDPLANPKNRSGWIEVITGSMFSGKTEELIRRLKRAGYANQKIEIYHPKTDTRAGKEAILSHNNEHLSSIAVSHSSEILTLSNQPNVIGIDECQFFDDQLPDVCETLANSGIRVITADLDMDYNRLPFNPVPELLARSESVLKLQAICLKCGNPASFSHRKTAEKEQVLVGAGDRYEPLCRKCFNEVNAK